jgi:two-component system sensor histidine kinase KdpD
VSSLRSAEIEWSRSDQQELLTTADSALDRLTALVTNLLDLSRLQAGALSVNVEAVALEEVLARVIDVVSRSDLLDIDLSPDLAEVRADPGLLERAVANLVENAVRYSPPGVRVRLTAGTLADTAELRIVDRGPGIPEAARAAVFEPFQRRDDRAVSTGAGVGLGLAIARGFVEAMHGRIWLEDTPGGGLTAAIQLPLAERGHPVPEPTVRHPAEAWLTRAEPARTVEG